MRRRAADDSVPGAGAGVGHTKNNSSAPAWPAWMVLLLSIATLGLLGVLAAMTSRGQGQLGGAAGGGGDLRSRQANQPAAPLSPVPAVMVVEEHHHVVAQYIHAVNTGMLNVDVNASAAAGGRKATILHVDSHADLGVPASWQTQHGWPGAAHDIEASVDVMDFLLQAVHLGIADHIIFAEPPWAMQFRCCFDLDVGGGDGDAARSPDGGGQRPRQGQPEGALVTWDLVVGHDPQDGELKVNSVNGSPEIARFQHVFWRDGAPRITDDHSLLEGAVPFKLTLLKSEDAHRITAVVDPTKPLILDLDLDAWSTESPGAGSMRQALGCTNTDLMVLYHLFHGFRDLGDAFRREVEKGATPDIRGVQNVDVDADADADVGAGPNGAEARSGAGAQTLKAPMFEARARAMLNAAANHAGMSEVDRHPPPDWVDSMLLPLLSGASEQRVEAIRDWATAVSLRTGIWEQTDWLRTEIESFLWQPFHIAVNDEEIDGLVRYWRAAFAALRTTPSLVHIIRSPSYTPADLLPKIECSVLGLLAELYNVSTLWHESRVDSNRTGCHEGPGATLRHAELVYGPASKQAA